MSRQPRILWERLNPVSAGTDEWCGPLRVRRLSWPARPGPEGPRLRLLFFSDLHWEGAHPSIGQALRDAARTWAPDWVLFGGDLTRYPADEPGAFGILRDVRGRLGTIAVMGNRETSPHRRSYASWQEAYANAGCRLLVNESVTVADGRLAIAGIDEPRHGRPDPIGVLAALDAPDTLLLSHSPDAIVDLAQFRRPALALCGHTHGGQIRLPGVGALYTSSRFGRRFDRGLFENANGAGMFVTTGTGVTGPSWLRRRLFCPAEVVLLEWVLPVVISSPNEGAD